MNTHTFVVMDIPAPAFAHIKAQLLAAGYDHAIIGDTIDMHGIGVQAAPVDPEGPTLVTADGRPVYAPDRQAVLEAVAGLTDEAFDQFCIALMQVEIRGYFSTFVSISEIAKASIRALGTAASRFIRRVS